MIDVLKHGDFVDDYYAVCERCGCEFKCQTEDLVGFTYGTPIVACPECKDTVSVRRHLYGYGHRVIKEVIFYADKSEEKGE
ncbi:MAG: hypothetical protein J6Y37_14420 [Paludibacteraceae bacterium]|nr:hypothetical protein [Paludibacteraceae bacterium]